ncbi:hypothetical protein F4780DRAFT_321764 [Xylariomycetidae sp. FL0641]|nr:hypothetical protein F4780DRAFT_321764 [Xylariomycetidae sp. FL0641]
MSLPPSRMAALRPPPFHHVMPGIPPRGWSDFPRSGCHTVALTAPVCRDSLTHGDILTATAVIQQRRSASTLPSTPSACASPISITAVVASPRGPTVMLGCPAGSSCWVVVLGRRAGSSCWVVVLGRRAGLSGCRVSRDSGHGLPHHIAPMHATDEYLHPCLYAAISTNLCVSQFGMVPVDASRRPAMVTPSMVLRQVSCSSRRMALSPVATRPRSRLSCTVSPPNNTTPPHPPQTSHDVFQRCTRRGNTLSPDLRASTSIHGELLAAGTTRSTPWSLTALPVACRPQVATSVPVARSPAMVEMVPVSSAGPRRPSLSAPSCDDLPIHMTLARPALTTSAQVRTYDKAWRERSPPRLL